jgi:hypothetical protein
MEIWVWVLCHPQVLHPMGAGSDPLFHPQVYPNPNWVFSGAGFKSHSRVTHPALKISLI